MKLHGKPIPRHIETLVLPRGNGENLVFRAAAVSDYESFNKLCPVPQPPTIVRPGQPPAQDTTDEKYKKALNEWAQQNTHWLVLESLKATEGLEWETVKDNDPSTWGNYQKELSDCGLSVTETMKIVNLVLDANGLNEKKIEEATKAFLAGKAATPAVQ